MLYDQMITEREKIEKQLLILEAKIKQCPPGKLLCSRNGKHYKWYQSDGHVHNYIPKKERHLAEQLAIKKYLCCQHQDLINEKNAIDAYLAELPAASQTSLQLLTEESEYQRLLAPYFKPVSQELTAWMNASYEQNPKYPENKIHKTPSGHLVRSKSEALIAMALYMHNIPFRYECALILNDVTMYPDFTIRHPRTGETYYWEHFGLMDNASYSQNAFTKMQIYTTNGIIPSIHLITTYENKQYPINAESIHAMIEKYFL